MKYRKKPAVIDAVQFRSDWSTGTVSFPSWMVRAIAKGLIDLDEKPGFALIKAPEGLHSMIASHNDWIILGESGAIYTCKSDVFAATYEPAE